MILYDRYQKLQKYVLGKPVDPPEYKKGDLVDNEAFENITDCETDTHRQYRWELEPDEYICEETSKYEVFYYQQSTDEGQTWVNTIPEQKKTGKLLEENSFDCGYVAYRWEVLPDEYVCDGYNKMKVEIYQQTTDGEHWTNVVPEQKRNGDLIEENSEDCGYRVWKKVEDEYICENDNGTYTRFEKLQAYHKDGDTIYEPYEFKKGEIINTDNYPSMDACENDYFFIWLIIEGEYICDNGDKYEKEVYKTKRFDDEIWVNAEPYQERKGDIIEKESSDCGITWESTDLYVCDEII